MALIAPWPRQHNNGRSLFRWPQRSLSQLPFPDMVEKRRQTLPVAPGVRIAVSGRPPVTRFPGAASGARFGFPDSPWARSLVPSAPQRPSSPCSSTSQLLRPSLTSPYRSSSATDSSFPQRPRPRQRGGTETSQVPVQRVRACLGSSTPRDSVPPRHSGGTDAGFGQGGRPRHPGRRSFRCSVALPTRAPVNA